MLITVHIEWPTGSDDEEIEMPDDSTPEQIDEACKEAFFEKCNYGYSINGEAQ